MQRASLVGWAMFSGAAIGTIIGALVYGTMAAMDPKGRYDPTKDIIFSAALGAAVMGVLRYPKTL